MPLCCPAACSLSCSLSRCTPCCLYAVVLHLPTSSCLSRCRDPLEPLMPLVSSYRDPPYAASMPSSYADPPPAATAVCMSPAAGMVDCAQKTVKMEGIAGLYKVWGDEQGCEQAMKARMC